MKNWYSITNKHNDVLDISIHDEIGLWGVSAKDFISDLKSSADVKSINLSIHSPGGSVLDGLAMYNALKAHPAKVYAHVDGLAASAASFILMAGDSISMPEDAFIMIHNAHGGVFGDAEEMREMANVVEKLQDSIVNIYEKRTGKESEDIRDMMKDETWMNANDALEHGFIDTISEAINVAAKLNIFNRYFKTMPIENIKGAENIETLKDFQNALRDAGVSRKEADALISRAKVIFQGDPDKPNDSMNLLSEALNKVKIPIQINA